MSFLTPQDRTPLLESLRPPADYQLSSAIGTTYSLDLIALMVAPVGFTFFDVDTNDPDFLQKGPLEILEAIRRHASKIALFCEAGRIAVPKHHRPLLTYLEDRIVEARAPMEGHAFHPKVWIIRYSNSAGDIRYRLLCLSRNLTFDRSWDTVLVLDGVLRSERVNGFGENAGLRDFVSALPRMAITKVSDGIRDQVKKVADEISRVEWDLTGMPFDAIKFCPLGLTARKVWPFPKRLQQNIIISPFVSEGILSRLSAGTKGSVLISRPESLDKIAETALGEFAVCYQLKTQFLTTEPEDVDLSPASETPIQGLHAKLYIADDGWKARLWTGSANATTSAFSGNVEFLAELSGKKSEIGVSAFLEKVKGTTSFSDLLEPYNRSDFNDDDPALEALMVELDKLRMSISIAEWIVEISPELNGQGYVPIARTKLPLPQWGNHISVSCRPLSVGEYFAQLVVPATTHHAAFNAMALESLTAFLVIEIRGDKDNKKAMIQFVVNAKLIGAPPNRRDRILQHMIHDRRALVRFLIFLLADVGDDPIIGNEGQSNSWGVSSNKNEESEALLEPLLRTLSRYPDRLKAIENLLRDLGSTEEGAKLMPEGLSELFAAIWSASEESAL